MQSIVIRHLSGTRSNQVQRFPFQGFREILIGREANSQIRYDAHGDDLVGRNHARIVRDPADPNGFLLTDLESRNGTFINRRRICGASRLLHGDRVQLGPSGPEFSFELDPPSVARATRPVANAPSWTPEKSFRVPGGLALPPGMSGARLGDVPRPIGHATVDHFLGEISTQTKAGSRKAGWTAVISSLVVLLAGAGYFAWSRAQQPEDRQRRADEAKQAGAQLDSNNKARLADHNNEAAPAHAEPRGNKAEADRGALRPQAEGAAVPNSSEPSVVSTDSAVGSTRAQAGPGAEVDTTRSTAGRKLSALSISVDAVAIGTKFQGYMPYFGGSSNVHLPPGNDDAFGQGDGIPAITIYEGHTFLAGEVSPKDENVKLIKITFTVTNSARQATVFTIGDVGLIIGSHRSNDFLAVGYGSSLCLAPDKDRKRLRGIAVAVPPAGGMTRLSIVFPLTNANARRGALVLGDSSPVPFTIEGASES